MKKKDKKKNKVFVLGKDAAGWSIDSDRKNTIRVLNELGYRVVKNPFIADVIFCVWWNLLDNIIWRLILAKKKVIATVTNDLKHQHELVLKLSRFIDIWVVANKLQQKDLIECGVRTDRILTNPYYVNELIFKRKEIEKKVLAEKIGLEYSKIKGKLLIGSFQRDSLGRDLQKQKWQKNPDLLVDILIELNREDVMLVIAGPRRHYIVNKCIENKLPYVFVGNEKIVKSNVDDIHENNLATDKMSDLYNLVDLYIVTSKSEGGPKAVLESTLSKTAIISTPVGIANEFISEECIFSTKREAILLISKRLEDRKYFDEIVEDNYGRAIEVNNINAFKTRIDGIVKVALYIA